METMTAIWKEYQRGLDYFNANGLFERCERSHQMVGANQWEGLKSGDERPAQLNILLPMLKSATAMVGQNTMSIRYSSLNYDTRQKERQEVCEKMNRHAARLWERLKLDRYIWSVLQDAFIAGDAFLYFYDEGGQIKMEAIDTTNIMLADEQNPNIQEQPYILIIQRRYVDEVRKEAKENGLSSAQIAAILPDGDVTGQIGGELEVDNDQKLISLMKLWKEDGVVHCCRSTRGVVYEPPRAIEGLSLYPVAQYSWRPQKGAARGIGDIWDKIPNQLSINKNLYRFECAVKSSAFPHKVYNAGALEEGDIKKLSYPDSNIAVQDLTGGGVDKLIGYLQPASISPYAKDIWQEIIVLTRELAGMGDNLENVDPERATGAAINAAREARLFSVNAQVAALKQFIEDIAFIWYDLWTAYHPGGLFVMVSKEGGEEGVETISQESLKELMVEVRIDVSPSSPYSKLAQELALKELFTSGAIDFFEYVEALDEDSSLPKGKLLEIAQRRKQAENQKAVKTIMELGKQVERLQAENRRLKGEEEKNKAPRQEIMPLKGREKGGKTHVL